MPDPTSPAGPDPHPGTDTGTGRAPGAGDPAEQSGRSRLGRALVRPARNQLVVAVLLALLGFAAVTQVRSNEVDDTYAGLREQDLIDVLNGLAGTSQRAEAEIADLERARTELQDDTSRRQAALEQAQTQADNLSILAGVVPVTGPGIRITITDPAGTVGLGAMLDTVQELRTVGAEAMQVNGKVRVVAHTAFESAPNGYLVDGTLVEPPYVIDVIGEPNVLSGALNFALGPRQQIERDGGGLQVQELSSLDIEATVDPDPPQFADPQ